jgi:mannose-6-phosphate isomerase-like protein (cupin superfamily)
LAELGKIQDVWIRELDLDHTAYGERFAALRFHEHVLRRFGSLEVIKLTPQSKTEPLLRHEADELWVLVEGSVQCRWQDARPASPTAGEKFAINITQPAQIFVPFGVAFALQAGHTGALMLRAATHEPGTDPLDALLTWEEIVED